MFTAATARNWLTAPAPTERSAETRPPPARRQHSLQQQRILPAVPTACYWAHVSRLVFGATSYDVATNGFEDLQLYRELATGIEQRSCPRSAQAERSGAKPRTCSAGGPTTTQSQSRRNTDSWMASGREARR